GLILPVAEDGGRADEERRPLRAARPVPLDEGEGLDGLAQTHVVGQAGSEPARAQEREPGVPAPLVGTQRALEPFGGGELLERGMALQASEQVPERARGLHAVEGEARE